MVKRDAQVEPGKGLQLPGPLTGQISTLKVGIRPPDLPLIEKIRDLLREVEESGGTVPGGSSLSIRTIDGFVQIKDLKNISMDIGATVRVIEHDPSRGTFLVGGDGEADLITEISWYVLRALPGVHVLLFIPNDNGPLDTPRDRSKRISQMLDVARMVKEEDEVILNGLKIVKLSSLKELKDASSLRSNDHSRSQ